nr:host-nuclease inhibitor Gam family protein [Clostridia bacterium]
MSEILNEFYELPEDQYEGWAILDDKAAQWAVEQIANAKADTQRWKAHFEDQLRKIREANEQTVAFMAAKLEAYFDTLPHKKTATQESYLLPGAKLVRKLRAPQYVVDEERLVEHLRTAAPELIKTEEVPCWGEYKKRCQVIGGELVDSTTGELVDGVTVVERDAQFVVEVKIGGEK